MFDASVDVDGLEAGDVTAASQRRSRRRASASCGSSLQKRRSVIARSELTWRRVCSAPTAFAARRARIRSIVRPCAGSARRSSRALDTARRRCGCSSAATRASRAPGSSASWPAACSSQGAIADERRRHPDAGDRVSDARDGLRRRHRDLRVAQSVRGQRHQGVLGRGEKFTEALERAGRSDRRRRRGSVPAGDAAPVEQVDSSRAYIGAPARDRCRTRTRCAACAIVVDCANGATTTVAPRLFEELGLRRHAASACEPDGRNINLRLRIDASRAAGARRSSSGGYPLGMAFDGDGDRAIFVDDDGHVVDGDAVHADVRDAAEARRAAARATRSSRP